MNTHITQYCTIRQHTISLNGEVVVQHQEPTDSLETFLVSTYRTMDIQYPKFFKMDVLCKLAFLATEVLLSKAETAERYVDTELGITLCNGSSSILTDLNHQKTIQDKEEFFPSPAVFVYTLPNIMIGEISIRHQIRGENTLFLAEKFDSTTVSNYAQYLLAENISKACICGWIDASPDSYDAFLYLVESSEKVPVADDQPLRIHSIESIQNLYISHTL